MIGMRNFFSVLVILAVQILMLIFLATTLASTEKGSTALEITLAPAQDVNHEIVTVLGKLSCDLGNQNTGNPCILLLTEASSGKVFRLVSEGPAMRVFFDGFKQVAVRGKLGLSDTLEVMNVEKR